MANANDNGVKPMSTQREDSVKVVLFDDLIQKALFGAMALVTVSATYPAGSPWRARGFK